MLSARAAAAAALNTPQFRQTEATANVRAEDAKLKLIFGKIQEQGNPTGVMDTLKGWFSDPDPATFNPVSEQRRAAATIQKFGVDFDNPASVRRYVVAQFEKSKKHSNVIKIPGASAFIHVPGGNPDKAYAVVFYNTKTGKPLGEEQFNRAVKTYLVSQKVFSQGDNFFIDGVNRKVYKSNNLVTSTFTPKESDAIEIQNHDRFWRSFSGLHVDVQKTKSDKPAKKASVKRAAANAKNLPAGIAALRAIDKNTTAQDIKKIFLDLSEGAALTEYNRHREAFKAVFREKKDILGPLKVTDWSTATDNVAPVILSDLRTVLIQGHLGGIKIIPTSITALESITKDTHPLEIQRLLGQISKDDIDEHEDYFRYIIASKPFIGNYNTSTWRAKDNGANAEPKVFQIVREIFKKIALKEKQ